MTSLPLSRAGLFASVLECLKVLTFLEFGGVSTELATSWFPGFNDYGRRVVEYNLMR